MTTESTNRFTTAQYEQLGRLIEQYTLEHPVSVQVTREFAGSAMLAQFTWRDGSQLLVGIEPDGYSHT